MARICGYSPSLLYHLISINLGRTWKKAKSMLLFGAFIQLTDTKTYQTL